MTRQRRPRTTDPEYLAWLRTQRCACGCLNGPPCDAAHIRATSFTYEKLNPGIGQKPDDKWALPLWHACHMDQHAHGNEIDWWQFRGIRDPFALAIRHYREFRRRHKRAKPNRPRRKMRKIVS
jgi:hypothetical protein